MQMRGDHVLLMAGEPDGVGEVGGKPVAGEQQRRGDQQNGKRRDREVDERGGRDADPSASSNDRTHAVALAPQPVSGMTPATGIGSERRTIDV